MPTTNHPDTACTGVILAGGMNKRFAGKNKAFLNVGKRRIIDHIFDVFRSVFNEIIIVSNAPMKYLEWDANIMTDIYPARSSLTGIHTGLFYAQTPFIFVTACDTPFLKKAMVETVVSQIEPDSAVVIPETHEGTEQLCAAYSKSCLSLMERQIIDKKFQIKKLFRKVRVKKLPESLLRQADSELISFFNINTAEDYSKAIKHFQTKEEDIWTFKK